MPCTPWLVCDRESNIMFNELFPGDKQNIRRLVNITEIATKKWNIQCSSELFKLCIRVLYTRILRICVCLFAHIHAYIRTYMSFCYSFPEVSLYEPLLGKQRTLWKKLQSNICILLKTSFQIMKAIIFRALDHFSNSPLPFLNTWS